MHLTNENDAEDRKKGQTRRDEMRCEKMVLDRFPCEK